MVASTLLTLGYFVKVFAAWFHEPATAESEGLAISPSLGVGVGVATVSLVALGIWSDPVFQFLFEVATP